MNEKIERLRALIEKDTKEKFRQQGYTDMSVHFDSGIKTTVKPGKKYTKVDVGRSGKYMIDHETEEIFGIKGYGVIHRGHRYGTLDTVEDWFWGEYRAVKTA